MKKFWSILLAAALLAAALAGCRSRGEESGESGGKAVTIRYLNFKPEVAGIYEEISRLYQQETGVRVLVETAGNNSYEQTLAAKMGTAEAPTIFQINGPRGFASWKDYCADLTDTELYKHLTDPDAAVSSGGGVYGIPYVVEGYGIIYNKAITDRYFALENRGTAYTSMEEINSFGALSALVKDMQAHREELGIRGVFGVTSLKAGEDWRWQTHLANLPVYYEFKNNNVDLTGEDIKNLAFEYGGNFKNIFDLYIDNSTTDRKLLGSKIVDESTAEFATGQCAMVQNGNWVWNQMKNVSGLAVRAEDVRYLPIYIGIEGEEKQGLCIGTENFYCINRKASQAEQQAAADFLYWLYSSETGKRIVTQDLGFIAPFDTFTEEEMPEDPLAREVAAWMRREDVVNIPWNFTIFPSQTFKADFGSALLRYAQGTMSWDEVEELVKDRWLRESEAIL